MADAASFTLKLIDQLTGPGRRMAKAIDEINRKLRSAKGMAALTRAQFATLAQVRGLDALGRGVDWLVGKLGDAAKNASLLVGLLGTGAAAYVTKNVVAMGTYADTTRKAMSFLTGSEAKGAEAFERIRRTAQALGIDVQKTTDSFKHLLAMQFSIGEAEELVKISADLQAITGDVHAVERALRAITQIKAKGRLMQEELTQQLAEAGVSSMLVYEELGKAMGGKSVADVRAAITAGAVNADLGIAAIKKAILRKVHQTEAGEAAKGFSMSTITGMFERLKNAPKNLFLSAADRMEKDFEGLKGTLRDIIAMIEGFDPGKIAAFVGRVLEYVRDLVPLVKEFTSGFGEGFAEVLSAMTGGTASTTENLMAARDAGRDLAKAFALGLKLARMLTGVMAWFVTPLGKATAIAGLVTVGFLKLLSVIGSITIAVGAAGGKVGALAVGWTTLKAGVLAAGSAILSALAAVGSVIMAIVTAPAFIASAIAAATVGIIAAIWVWREEIAKFMLFMVDAAGKAWVDLENAIYDAIVGAFRAAWTIAVKFWEAIKNLFTNIFTGDVKLADFGVGTAREATARALGRPAVDAAQRTRPLGTPELSPAMQSIANGRGGDTRIETKMTVNVQGDAAQSGGRELGRQVAEGAREPLESFFSDLNLQSGYHPG